MELRHTCLTRLREAGMALEAVQAQAGHVSIETTRIYLHLSDSWLADEYRRAAEAIDAQMIVDHPAITGSADEPPRERSRAGETFAESAPTVTATLQRYLGSDRLRAPPDQRDPREQTYDMRTFAAFMVEPTTRT